MKQKKEVIGYITISREKGRFETENIEIGQTLNEDGSINDTSGITMSSAIRDAVSLKKIPSEMVMIWDSKKKVKITIEEMEE